MATEQKQQPGRQGWLKRLFATKEEPAVSPPPADGTKIPIPPPTAPAPSDAINEPAERMVAPPPSLVLAAIVKNEAPYLLEWIAYHRAVGVDHFIIMDNESTDGTFFLLRPLAEAGVLTYFRWNNEFKYKGFEEHNTGPQVPAYNFAFRVANKLNHWDWIGFIDLDEFILPTESATIGDVLRGFSSSAAVGVNWRMFGSSGHKSAPKGLITENFTHCAIKSFSANQHVKSIARVAKLRQAGIHIHNSADGDVVDMAGQRISPARAGIHDAVVHDKLVINHYFTKSHEEWLRKRVKGNVSSRIIDPDWERPHEMFAAYDRNEIEETAILRFLPEIRRGIDELNEMIRNFSGRETSSASARDL